MMAYITFFLLGEHHVFWNVSQKKQGPDFFQLAKNNCIVNKFWQISPFLMPHELLCTNLQKEIILQHKFNTSLALQQDSTSLQTEEFKPGSMWRPASHAFFMKKTDVSG